MKQKQLWQGIWAGTGMLLLVLDGETAVSSAGDGVRLCLNTVIPCLLPFFLLSNLVNRSMSGVPLPLLRPLARRLRLPKGGECLLIPAFLGGYPMGAQAVSQAWRAGQLSRETARRMLSFCSNAGPAFLLGMLMPLFPKAWMAPCLWLIHMSSALLVGVLYPGGSEGETMTPRRSGTMSSPMEASLRGMAAVCGWVVCFRVVSGFLEKWILWQCPLEFHVILSGLLELTGGCAMLTEIPSVAIRFIICSGLTGFGGLCIVMQTVSILHGLPVRSYLIGKALQAFISLLLSSCVIFRPGLLPILGFFLLILIILKRSSGIPAPNAV